MYCVYNMDFYIWLSLISLLAVSILADSLNVTITNGSTVSIREGDATAILSCIATGNPLPSVTWLHEGELVAKSPCPTDSLEFILHDVDRSHAGVYSCYASNRAGKSETKVVIVEVQYAPNVTIVNGSTVAITEGDRQATLTCHATGNPLPTIIWIDAVKQAFRSPYPTGSLDYTLYDVDRTHAGLYSCSASNYLGTIAAQFVEVEVHYIPDVRLIAKSGTVDDAELKLVCVANGIPQEYTFSWSHSWPGYGAIHHNPDIGDEDTLILTNLTYQHSGIYACAVRNSATGSKHENAGHASDFVQVESFPIVTDPHLEDGEIFLVAAAPAGDAVTVSVRYFSNSANNSVGCRKMADNGGHSRCDYSWTREASDILLPVYSQRIPTRGTHILVTIHLLHQDAMGLYDIVLQNTIGVTLFPIDIVPEGRPGAPETVQILSMSHTSVTLSWRTGFHGGFNQTIVIQLKKGTGDWYIISSTETGTSMYRVDDHATVDTLIPNTRYFVRLYAYNLIGRSGYTKEMAFLTACCSCGEQKIEQNNDEPVVLLSIVGASVVVVIIVASILSVFIIKRKRHMTWELEIDQKHETVGNDGYITPLSGIQTDIAPYMDAQNKTMDMEGNANVLYNNNSRCNQRLGIQRKQRVRSICSKELWVLPYEDISQTSRKILASDEGYLDMNIIHQDNEETQQTHYMTPIDLEPTSGESNTVADVCTAPTTYNSGESNTVADVCTAPTTYNSGGSDVVADLYTAPTTYNSGGSDVVADLYTAPTTYNSGGSDVVADLYTAPTTYNSGRILR